MTDLRPRYHIAPTAPTIISGPHAVTSTYVKKLTRCGNPELLDLTAYDLVPQVWPELAEGYRYGGEPTVRAHVVEMGVEAIPIEELAQQAGVALAMNIDRLDAACRAYIDKHAHWSGGLMAADKAKAGKPKAQAVFVWAERVWDLYFERKALLKAGTPWTDDLADFSSIPCPHDMDEIRAE